MQFQSTRDPNTIVSSSEAILRGLAPDGGLFVPTAFPKAELEDWKSLSYPELAQKVLAGFLTDYDPAFLGEAAAATYGDAFAGKAGYVQKVHDGLYSLELWHGPTCAFKDYALQLMPKLLVQAKKNLGRTETTRILAATSGDNVSVYAVNGNFDDAQTGVKRVFGDASVAEELEKRNICLSSANSINWGRLVPQIVYYFYAYFRLVEQGNVAWGQPVDFCVPTGNFGDILAGYYAKQMGLPVGKLVCASNKNNVLTDFIKTGTYDARRTFYKTTSPSMDILISSNLERLLYHVSGSSAKVAGWMADLAKTGMYTVDAETLARIQASFACGCADDTAGAAEINARFEQDNYLCDTHTAVAFCVAETVRSAAPMVVLSTASPYKFPRDVLAALGETAPESDFAAMAALNVKTGCPVPASLSVLNTLPVRFNTVIEPAAIRDAALK